jgi:hypothetical protein
LRRCLGCDHATNSVTYQDQVAHAAPFNSASYGLDALVQPYFVCIPFFIASVAGEV